MYGSSRDAFDSAVFDESLEEDRQNDTFEQAGRISSEYIPGFTDEQPTGNER